MVESQAVDIVITDVKMPGMDQFEAQERERSGLNALIGESQAVVKMKAEIRQVAATGHTTVLIVGETGTGKELVARAGGGCSVPGAALFG